MSTISYREIVPTTQSDDLEMSWDVGALLASHLDSIVTEEFDSSTSQPAATVERVGMGLSYSTPNLSRTSIRADILEFERSNNTTTTNFVPKVTVLNKFRKSRWDGSVGWLHGSPESETYLRSMDASISWSRSDGWEVQALLHDAKYGGIPCGDPNIPGLVTVSSTTGVNTSFSEVVDAFLRAETRLIGPDSMGIYDWEDDKPKLRTMLELFQSMGLAGIKQPEVILGEQIPARWEILEGPFNAFFNNVWTFLQNPWKDNQGNWDLSTALEYFALMIGWDPLGNNSLNTGGSQSASQGGQLVQTADSIWDSFDVIDANMNVNLDPQSSEVDNLTWTFPLGSPESLIRFSIDRHGKLSVELLSFSLGGTNVNLTSEFCIFENGVNSGWAAHDPALSLGLDLGLAQIIASYDPVNSPPLQIMLDMPVLGSIQWLNIPSQIPLLPYSQNPNHAPAILLTIILPIIIVDMLVSWIINECILSDPEIGIPIGSILERLELADEMGTSYCMRSLIPVLHRPGDHFLNALDHGGPDWIENLLGCLHDLRRIIQPQDDDEPRVSGDDVVFNISNEEKGISYADIILSEVDADTFKVRIASPPLNIAQGLGSLNFCFDLDVTILNTVSLDFAGSQLDFEIDWSANGTALSLGSISVTKVGAVLGLDNNGSLYLRLYVGDTSQATYDLHILPTWDASVIVQLIKGGAAGSLFAMILTKIIHFIHTKGMKYPAECIAKIANDLNLSIGTPSPLDPNWAFDGAALSQISKTSNWFGSPSGKPLILSIHNNLIPLISVLESKSELIGDDRCTEVCFGDINLTEGVFRLTVNEHRVNGVLDSSKSNIEFGFISDPSSSNEIITEIKCIIPFAGKVHGYLGTYYYDTTLPVKPCLICIRDEDDAIGDIFEIGLDKTTSQNILTWSPAGAVVAFLPKLSLFFPNFKSSTNIGWSLLNELVKGEKFQNWFLSPLPQDPPFITSTKTVGKILEDLELLKLSPITTLEWELNDLNIITAKYKPNTSSVLPNLLHTLVTIGTGYSVQVPQGNPLLQITLKERTGSTEYGLNFLPLIDTLALGKGHNQLSILLSMQAQAELDRWTQSHGSSIPAGFSIWFLKEDNNTLSGILSIELAGIDIRLQRTDGEPLLDGFMQLGGLEIGPALDLNLLPSPSTFEYGGRLKIDDFGLRLDGRTSDDEEEKDESFERSLLCQGKWGDSKPTFDLILSDFITKNGAANHDFLVHIEDGKPEVWKTIDKGFGPVYIYRIGIAYKPEIVAGQTEHRIAILLDGFFGKEQLALIFDDFGISFLISNPLSIKDWSFELAGAGIVYDVEAVKIYGALRKTKEVIEYDKSAATTGFEIVHYSPPNPGEVNANGQTTEFGFAEYSGICVIKIGDKSINAMGALAKIPDPNKPKRFLSAFVIAGVAGDLGGSAAFKLEGLAGGLGLNRGLEIPTIDDVSSAPMIKLLNDFCPEPSSAGTSAPPDLFGMLDSAKSQFPIQHNSYWLAAGLRFTNYLVVRTSAMAYVQVGGGFKVGLLGLTSLTLGEENKKTGFLELAWLAQLEYVRRQLGDDEVTLRIEAMFTDNSWLISKDVKLTGGLALYAWFHKPELVLSIGGYHPSFTPPDYYPVLSRLGLWWQPDNITKVGGEVYFALTSSSVQLGAYLEVNHNREKWGVGAYFGFDALVKWEPFYYNFAIKAGCHAYLVIAGRKRGFDIKADLLLEGPDFRGTASVDFGVKKSSFKFGNHNTPIIVAHIGGYHFLRKHILQEEAPTSPDATIPDLEQRLFSTNISNGLIGTTNRSSVGPSLVESEFSLSFETLFPSTDADFAAKLINGKSSQQVAPSKPEYDIVSMDVKDIDSIINLELYRRGNNNLPITSVQAEEINVEWLKGSFPAAVWECQDPPRSKPKSFKFYSGAKISFDAIPEDPSGEIQADLQEYADDPLDLPLADKSNKIVKPDNSMDEIGKKTITDFYYGDFESDDLFQPIGGTGTDLEEGSNSGKELVIDWSNKEVSVLELIIVDLPLQPGHKAAPILEEDGKRDYEEEPFGGEPPS